MRGSKGLFQTEKKHALEASQEVTSRSLLFMKCEPEDPMNDDDMQKDIISQNTYRAED